MRSTTCKSSSSKIFSILLFLAFGRAHCLRLAEDMNCAGVKDFSSGFATWRWRISLCSVNAWWFVRGTAVGLSFAIVHVFTFPFCECVLVCLCAPKHNYKFSRWRVWWFVRGKERWRRESWANGWGLEGKSSHTNTHKHSHTNAYAFKDNYDKHNHKTC